MISSLVTLLQGIVSRFLYLEIFGIRLYVYLLVGFAIRYAVTFALSRASVPSEQFGYSKVDEYASADKRTLFTGRKY